MKRAAPELYDRMRQGKHPVLNKSFYCPPCCSKHAVTIIQHLRKLDTLFIFHLPVTDAVAPNYRDVVKEPMDLQTMEKRAKEGKDKNYLWLRESFEPKKEIRWSKRLPQRGHSQFLPEHTCAFLASRMPYRTHRR